MNRPDSQDDFAGFVTGMMRRMSEGICPNNCGPLVIGEEKKKHQWRYCPVCSFREDAEAKGFLKHGMNTRPYPGQ
jgi:hypothetical protein